MIMSFAAQDVGGSAALGHIADGIGESLECRVNRYLGFGQKVDWNWMLIEDALKKSDITIVGMSSSKALSALEILAMDSAIEANKPFVVFADTFNSHNRPWFEQYLPKAAAFFVLNEKEAVKATAKFPGIKAIPSGNPAWEHFAFPAMSCISVREKLGIRPGETVIMAVGTKDPAINCILFGAALEASKAVEALLLCSLHPGDKTHPNVYRSFEDPNFTKGRVRVVSPDEMKGDTLIAGANLVIDSMSTIAIQAGYLRIPVLTYLSELALCRQEYNNGTRKWEPGELGICITMNKINELYLTIGEYFGRGGGLDYNRDELNSMQQAQIAAFPHPGKRGAITARILDEIQKIA